jgi:hypothetical protein
MIHGLTVDIQLLFLELLSLPSLHTIAVEPEQQLSSEVD